MACRLVDAAASPAAAYGACYKSEGTAAELVRMAELAAGDRVVTAARDGSVALTRILVNQHAKAEATAAVITLETAAGRLSLTRDHALYIDGALAAAGEAKVGSRLVLAGGRTAVVERVTEQRAEAATINPITDSGTILASEEDGEPVLAAAHPIWIARFLLEQSVSPAPLPLGSILSRAFPASVQAYWDEVLEPLFAALPGARPLPAAATVGVLALGDVLLSAGFVAYAFAELLKWSGVGIALVCAGCTVIQQQRKKKASA